MMTMDVYTFIEVTIVSNHANLCDYLLRCLVSAKGRIKAFAIGK